jgi:hypothetical protein
LAESASCDSPAAVLRRRTWGPTRFCGVAAIAPGSELDAIRRIQNDCSDDGAI